MIERRGREISTLRLYRTAFVFLFVCVFCVFVFCVCGYFQRSLVGTTLDERRDTLREQEQEKVKPDLMSDLVMPDLNANAIPFRRYPKSSYVRG